MVRGELRTDVDEKITVQRLERLYAQEQTLLSIPADERRDIGRSVGVYSLTQGENGGANPWASAPFSIVPNGQNPPRRTSDCVGTAMWARGLDRYQPKRFPIYGGYINTNSMLMDAVGDFATTGRGSKAPTQKMFRPTTLRPGVFVVYPSRFVAGKRVPGSWGHILTVVDVQSGANEKITESSKLVTVIHCHGGLIGRTISAIARESLHKAIGRAVARAYIIELIPGLS